MQRVPFKCARFTKKRGLSANFVQSFIASFLASSRAGLSSENDFVFPSHPSGRSSAGTHEHVASVSYNPFRATREEWAERHSRTLENRSMLAFDGPTGCQDDECMSAPVVPLGPHWQFKDWWCTLSQSNFHCSCTDSPSFAFFW